MKKIIELMGDKGVGKSALMSAASHRPFAGDNASVTVSLPNMGEPITLLLKSGKPSHKENAILFVFDLNDEQSFNNLSAWLTEIERFPRNPDHKIFVVGCKSDLPKAVTAGKEWAESLGYPYWEVSAKEGTHVDALFQYVAACLAQNTYLDKNAFLKSLDDAAKKQAAKAESEHQDELNKAYLIILEKLNPTHINKAHAYQNFKEIRDQIEKINEITRQMESNSYHSQRALMRKALQKALIRLEEPFIEQWHNKIPDLKSELEALTAIKNQLHIIQSKASQHNKTKCVMLDVLMLIDAFNKKHSLAIMKNELEVDDAPAQPEKAMTFLSKIGVTNKEILRKLVNKHLMQPITTEKQNELASMMKALSDTERERLKKNLIRATKNETLDNTENYRKLLAEKDNRASLIPLIAMLCISGSGKINKKTNGYTAWLNYMNQSKAVTTTSYTQTFKAQGVVGTASQFFTRRKATQLNTEGKKRKKIEDDFFKL